MIPKIIHYCWFGGKPLPKLAKKCIKSWKKYCKGYEIREWNEQNFDISAAPLYVRQAYEAKKWAFITDYVRLFAMTTYGGIYMDTDVEVVKPLDQFLQHHAFSGFESETDIPTGIMACEKDFPLFVEFLKYYDTASFYNEDGSINMTTNVIIMTDICLKHGLVQNNEYQEVDGFALYPKEVFCPICHHNGKLEKTKETAAIHWFSASWVSKEELEVRNQRQRKRRRLERQEYWSYLPNRVLLNIIGEERYDRLKRSITKKEKKRIGK